MQYHITDVPKMQLDFSPIIWYHGFKYAKGGYAGMCKRITLVVLTLVLLLGMLPVTGFAAKQTEVDALIASATDSYIKTQESTGMTSLNGYCGKMVSHQLWHMGINTGLVSNHGNLQYDMYAKMNRTTGGYYTGDYPASRYTLQEALDAVSEGGTKDVYNVLVGFEWTNTQAGGKYGHVCVINGILNGKVYFMESYNTRYAPEGSVNICTIEEFVNMYKNWTLFEGLIHFTKDYGQANRRYDTDIFVYPRFEMTMRSQPCLLGSYDCRVLRTVSAGERLRVTAVVENADGELYYRVEEKDRIGYIVAQAAVLERTNVEDLSLQKLTLPELVLQDGDNRIGGTVVAEKGMVGAVELRIKDAAGETVVEQRVITSSHNVSLDQFNQLVDLNTLLDGRYTLEISGETAAAIVSEGQLDYSRQTVLLESRTFWVGEKGEETLQPKTAAAPKPDGWCWQDGKWYCFREGQPLTGWYTYMGVTYYLKDDGSVTTGWKKIDGIKRYFSDTGAMNTGWLRTRSGLKYSLSDGCFVKGWQTIGASTYYFNGNGYAQTRGVRTLDGVKYKFQSDGKAIPMN